jgi:protein O-mannosyl-transferase
MMDRMPQKRSPRPARVANNTPVKSKVWAASAGWLLLFCTTLIAYAPALRGGLVWDDNRHVTAPDLQSFHGLWRIWFELGATQQYYPLLHSAFWVEHRIWGDAVLGYHLTNIVLHAFSACLVVLIVKRLKLPGAWLAGFVFALHPVCVEAVAWISEQKSTLSAVFYLAAVFTYLHFDKTRSKSQYLLALGLFVLALLSKTVTATLPAVLLVLLWWMRGRLQWRRDVLPLLPWFGLAVPAGLLTSWVERVYIGAQGAEFTLPLPQRLLLAGRAPWFYAWKVLWPVNLMFSYPRWKIDPGAWWQYLFPVGLAALAIAFTLLARRNRGPLAAFLIFAGTLFPVLGFLNVFPFKYSYVADHFQYLALLAIVVPAASWLTALVGRMVPAKFGPIGLAALLLMTLGFATWQQTGIYRDEETLYRATLARNPDSYFAHLDLGIILVKTPERRPEAVAEFEEAVRVKPDGERAHLNLANALLSMPGRLPDAIAEYQTVLRMEPGSWEAHDNLGFAYAQTPGLQADAISEYHTALRIDPRSAPSHFELANVLVRMPGRLPEAVAEYEAAVRIDPNFAEAHNNLGNALSSLPGRLPEAIAEYRAASRIKPDFAEAHKNLANALSSMPGRLPEAISEYQEALRIDPDSAAVHFDFGNMLAQAPDRLPEAIAEYQAAIRLDPNSAEAHYSLAFALAQVPGRLPEAIAECQEMLRLSPNDGEGRHLMASLLAFRASLGR